MYKIMKGGEYLMKKILVLLTALTVAFTFSAATFADEGHDKAEKKAETAKVTAPAETVAKGYGEVTAVDVNAKTITVKSKKGGEKVIAITDASKISVGKETKAIADVKVGDMVKVKVQKTPKK